MREILITGCGGMLGEAVHAELTEKHSVYATDIDLNGWWLRYMDVRDIEEVKGVCERVNPDVIIHLAALTDMEFCQSNPESAYDTNFIGTVNMVRMARKYNAHLIYISSAGIFNGEKTYYNEDDIAEPLNNYAKSKYAGELVVKTYPNSTIIRAGWMMGGGPDKDKKFVNKIIKQIKKGKKEILAVKDKLGTPTYTYDLAKVILFVIDKEIYGNYNASCKGGCSRYDVAKEIVKDLGLKIKVKVVPSDYFKKEYFAERPMSEKLSTKKIREIYPESVRDWKKCLKEYLKKFDWL